MNKIWALMIVGILIIGCSQPRPEPLPPKPLAQMLFYDILVYPQNDASPTKISMYDDQRIRGSIDGHSVNVTYEDGSDFDWNDITVETHYAERTTPENMAIKLIGCSTENIDRTEIRFTFDSPKKVLTMYSADPSTQPIYFDKNRTGLVVTVPLWENCKDNVGAVKIFYIYDFAPSKPTPFPVDNNAIPPLPDDGIGNGITPTPTPAPITGGDELPPLPG